MSNVYFREVKLQGAWQKKAEEHAANGKSFSVRPFNKQTHWLFLEELCHRYDLVSTFDARERTAFFRVRSAEAV
jgi:hypothetical protein